MAKNKRGIDEENHCPECEAVMTGDICELCGYSERKTESKGEYIG